MNINQLLSVSQSSPQTQSQGAFSRPDSPNGFFQQALLQASDAQRASAPVLSDPGASQALSRQAQLSELGSLLSDALDMDPATLSATLDSLGFELSEGDLSALLTQLQRPNSEIRLDALKLDDVSASSPLNEIAARLTLMASFTGDAPQTAQEGSMDTAVLEAITQHLDINQTEAAQLVSALNVLVSQEQKSQPLPVATARFNNAQMPTIDAQAALKPQPDTFLAHVTAPGSATQVSSDTLMGALMPVESAPKGMQANESLLTGFSSATGSQPLASPSAQGFNPTVAPTPAALSTPFTSTAWPQQLGQQLVQISQRGGEQHVQLQLNPAELGPLSISLKFGDQGAQAHFLSAHAQVRQVLEQAIPQLREALAEQGISLGETSVGEQRDPNAQSFAQSSGRGGAGVVSNGGEESPGELLIPGAESSPMRLDGRVDLYA